jgi:hypothetical protein
MKDYVLRWSITLVASLNLSSRSSLCLYPRIADSCFRSPYLPLLLHSNLTRTRPSLHFPMRVVVTTTTPRDDDDDEDNLEPCSRGFSSARLTPCGFFIASFIVACDAIRDRHTLSSASWTTGAVQVDFSNDDLMSILGHQEGWATLRVL